MARECLAWAREAASNERWRDIVRILKWSKREYFIGLFEEGLVAYPFAALFRMMRVG